MKPKLWFGTTPTECDICSRLLKEAFIDGRVRGGGWALMCLHCFSQYGAGLGIGLGQKYDLPSLERIGGS